VVRDYSNIDFVGRRHTVHSEYNVEQVRSRVYQKNELIFGSMCNYVQYFAEIGGFDALLQLFKMGHQEDSESLGIKKTDSAKSNKDA